MGEGSGVGEELRTFSDYRKGKPLKQQSYYTEVTLAHRKTITKDSRP